MKNIKSLNIKITYYSHSVFAISYSNFNILIDPFFTKNPLFKHNMKLFNKCLDDIYYNFILLTHAHEDHFGDVVYIAKRCNSCVISNYEISMYLVNKYNITNIYSVNYGSFVDLDFGKLRYIWSNHSSSFCDGSYGGNPGGFLLCLLNKFIYISGDTGLNYDMKLIPIFCKKKIDLAILPVGGCYTMSFDDVLIASDFVECNLILACHYNTFSNIKINSLEYIKDVFKKKNKKIVFLNIGDSLFI